MAPWSGRQMTSFSSQSKSRNTHLAHSPPKRQQCGSNREQDRPGRIRKPGPMEAGFLPYLSDMLLRSRTYPDMFWRIRSPQRGVAKSCSMWQNPLT
jgi:hypothetical protein